MGNEGSFFSKSKYTSVYGSEVRRARPSIVRMARKETNPRFVHQFEPICKGRPYALMVLLLLAVPIAFCFFISRLNIFGLIKRNGVHKR